MVGRRAAAAAAAGAYADVAMLACWLDWTFARNLHPKSSWMQCGVILGPLVLDIDISGQSIADPSSLK